MDLSRMVFQDWSGLLRTVVVGMLAYVALVALLRVSGKRTRSKMNAFDFVVTVALGSTVATLLPSPEVVGGCLRYDTRAATHYVQCVAARVLPSSTRCGGLRAGAPARRAVSSSLCRYRP
jgi:hypothetical protein